MITKSFTRSQATAKARQLDPTAFAKVALDSPRRERYQILLEQETPMKGWGGGKAFLCEAFLVAAGPTWSAALEDFYDWV